MKANYNQIREFIVQRQPFKGNSCRAVKTDKNYTIYSYATVIYKEDYTDTSKPAYFNIDFYSAITNTLQNIIAEVIYGKTLKELRREKEAEAQKIDYSKLYYDRELKVKKEGFANNCPIEFDIAINDFNFNPDCKIGHFGYNIFYRTNAGINLKRYTTRTRLEKAVENRLKKEGFTILEWGAIK